MKRKKKEVILEAIYPDLLKMTSSERLAYISLVLSDDIQDDRFAVQGNNLLFLDNIIAEVEITEK